MSKIGTAKKIIAIIMVTMYLFSIVSFVPTYAIDDINIDNELISSSEEFDQDSIVTELDDELEEGEIDSELEEPAIEEPAVEEPTIEEPAVEEPTIEEPAVEEPTIEDSIEEIVIFAEDLTIYYGEKYDDNLLLSGVRAYNQNGADISDLLTISDYDGFNYKEGEVITKPGQYNITVAVVDDDEVLAETSRKVMVQMQIKPMGMMPFATGNNILGGSEATGDLLEVNITANGGAVTRRWGLNAGSTTSYAWQRTYYGSIEGNGLSLWNGTTCLMQGGYFANTSPSTATQFTSLIGVSSISLSPKIVGTDGDQTIMRIWTGSGAAEGIEVVETFRLDKGANFFTRNIEIVNNSATDLTNARLYLGGDVYFRGSDSTFGNINNANMSAYCYRGVTDGIMTIRGTERTPADYLFAANYSTGSTLVKAGNNLTGAVATSASLDSGYYIQWGDKNGGAKAISIPSGGRYTIDSLESFTEPGELQISTPGGRAAPASSLVSYNFTLDNVLADALPDEKLSINLSAASEHGWVTTVSPASLEMAGGTSVNVTVSVLIPEDAMNGMTDKLTLTANYSGTYKGVAIDNVASASTYTTVDESMPAINNVKITYLDNNRLDASVFFKNFAGATSVTVKIFDEFGVDTGIAQTANISSGGAINNFNISGLTSGTKYYLRVAAVGIPYPHNTTFFIKGDMLIPLISLSLNPTTASIIPGATQQLTAIYNPANTTARGLIWVSSDTNVATVSTSGLVTAVNTGSTTITVYSADDLTIFATCVVTVPAPYTISFETNGGTPVPANQYMYSGLITKPSDPAKTGYTFAGWFKEVALTNAWNFGSDTVTGITTLYAKWTANNYTVTFDKNTTDVVTGPTPSNKSVTYNTAYGTLATISRAGYTFNGWFNAATGGTKIETTTIMSNANNHALYARWTENANVTITYAAKTRNQADTAGGSVTPANQSVAPATGTALATATVKTGYHFVGWFNASDVAYATNLGTNLSFSPAKVGGLNVAGNYVALFEENANVAMTYAAKTRNQADTAGGSVSPVNQSVAPVTGAALSAATVNAGYHFVGWFNASDLAYAVNLGTNLSFSPAKVGGLNVAGNYVALFEENTNVTITYAAKTRNQADTAGGNVTPANQSVAPATGVASATATVNAGYRFVGWFRSTDAAYVTNLGTNLAFSPAKVGGLNIAGNYVALFEENTNVTITYAAKTRNQADTAGGTVSPANQSVAPATGATSATATVKNGYHFVGWFKSTDVAYATNLGTALSFSPAKVGGLNVAGDYVALFEENTNVNMTYTAKTRNQSDAAGGSVSPVNQSVAPVTGAALSVATANAGYHLVGWFKASDVAYATNLGTALSFSPAKVGGLNVAGDYVALFEENTNITITYVAKTRNQADAAGGSVSPANQSVAPATGVASATAMVKTGYRFVGWFRSTDVAYATNLGTALSFSPAKVGGLNVAGDYVALFEENANVNITYAAKTRNQANTAGGNVSSASQSVAPATGAASATATVNAGYRFVGWFNASDAAYATNLGTALSFSPAKVGGLNVAGDYVALFEENANVTITYAVKTSNQADAAGGNVTPTNQSVAPATGAASATATANAGYHLVGWFKSTDLAYAINLGTALSFSPAKVGGLNVAGDYVALFEENADVTITYAAKTLNQADGSGGSVDFTTQSVAPATGAASATATINAGYHFIGWFKASDGSYATNLGTNLSFSPEKVGGLNVAGDYVALFEEDGDIAITYTAKTRNGVDDAGGSVDCTSQSVAPATGVASATATANAGYHFVGWFKASDGAYAINLSTGLSFSPAKVGGLNVADDYVALFERNAPSSGGDGGGGGGDDDTIETPAEWEPSEKIKEMFDTVNHNAYIYGYDNKKFNPDANITRAEVAMIFFRLMKNNDKHNTVENVFIDVNSNDWYAHAINYLAKMGIIAGYEDGEARPNILITRAELVAIAARFDDIVYNRDNPFVDVDKDSWAYSYIISAHTKGWIVGYSDNTFKPRENITRAEVVTIVNRVIGRRLKKDNVSYEYATLFPDVSRHHWAFGDIIEASVKHGYERDNNGYEGWLDTQVR